MRILLATPGMWRPNGVALYTRDVACALREAGHDPLVFTTRKGVISDALEREGVPVADDLDALGAPPDVIQGGKDLETVAALLHFPEVPAVCACHARRVSMEDVLRFPQVKLLVAVDGPCRENLIERNGVAKERVRLVLNFVDLERFRPRPPLPPRPRRALLFGRFRDEWVRVPGFLHAFEEACRRTGIELDRMGPGLGKESLEPERLLPDYDLVFARGRSAIEALAVGAAVVIASPEGAGPLVTSDDLDRLRLLNFGGAATRPGCGAGDFVREIERYDAADAAVVSARVRKEAGRGEAVARLVAIYEEAREIHAAAGPADLTAVSRAGARAVARAHRKLRELEAHARAEAPERPGLRGVLTRLRSLARPRERRGRWQAP